MLSKIQYKKIDDKGIVPFTVKNDVSLEILTENKSKEKDLKYFAKDGTFYGELVAVRVFPIKNGLIDNDFISGVGLMVKNESEDGCWIIDAKNCVPLDGSNVLENKNEIDVLTENFRTKKDIVQPTFNEEKEDKKLFGFTYKQLLIIGVIAIIIRKI